MPCGKVLRERCPLRHVPRTSFITLHSLIARPTGMSRSMARYCIILPVARTAGVPRGRIPATFRCIRFRERRGAVALFRERALLHFTTLFRGQPRCHSEPPRMRRVEESTKAAEKRLLCNHAHIPTHKLYCSPARSFDFVPRYARHSAQDDRTGGVAGWPRGRIPRERCPLCRIPRTGVIAFYNTIPRPTAMSF